MSAAHLLRDLLIDYKIRRVEILGEIVRHNREIRRLEAELEQVNAHLDELPLYPRGVP
jgi:hypothetical protein